MQVKRTNKSDTKISLSISASQAYLADIKQKTLERLTDKANVPGFRDGKAPLHLVEKHLNPELLQSEFMEDALSHLYSQAVLSEKLRPIDRPQVTLKKFVPYTDIEFEAEVEILGEVKLPDYKKIKKSMPKVTVSDKDISDVIDSLKSRMGERKEVKRAAKSGDEAVIDFKGVDAKKEPIKGADGKEYPLVLGSDSFIPGFEDNVVGMKPGEEKDFTITFPKDYGVKSLANKKVTFSVTLQKLNEITEPKIDNAFAAKAGPFKTVKELKDSIKQELTIERTKQATQELEGEIIKEIAAKAKLNVPETLIEDQIERLIQETKQNLAYRGMTYKEFLEQEGKTEEQIKTEVARPQAEERVRVGLVLAEIADQEGLQVSDEEVDAKIAELKSRYSDPAMQAELDKPEARRDVGSQILTQKTIQKVVEYATS